MLHLRRVAWIFCTIRTLKLLLFLVLLACVGYIALLPGSLEGIYYGDYDLFSVLGRKVAVDDLVMKACSNLNETWAMFANSTYNLPESNFTGESPKGLHVYEYLINEPDKCKDEAPFLVLLLTVQRKQTEARQAIRQTWGKEDFVSGVRILRLFLLGKDTQWTNDGQQSLLEESRQYHDIIQQDYLDSYMTLTTKVLMGLKWVATYCPKASYVMKTDSDMFVNTEYLIKGLLKPDQPPRQNYITGHLLRDSVPNRDKGSKWYVSPEKYPKKRYPVFCSGTGYVFSVDLACKIASISPTVRWLYLEDVYIGLCLEKLGIRPVAPPKRSDFNIGRVKYSDCGYNRMVTSHHLSPGEIIRDWNRLQQNKHHCW